MRNKRSKTFSLDKLRIRYSIRRGILSKNYGHVLITGGTGSFGRTLLRRLLSESVEVITIFSRDEKKQDEMRNEFGDARIRYFIGDVRDKDSVDIATRGVDFIFHAAALKQVPSNEFFPMEAVKTNILGTSNVLSSAIDSGVKRAVILSTDKAVYPINAMGISKAMAEKVSLALSRSIEKPNKTSICITRYGNVMGSRGSVIPFFIERIRNNLPLLEKRDHGSP